MSIVRALIALVVEISLVGYPLRGFVGVKSGAIVRCPQCGRWKLAWAAECSACGGEQTSTFNQRDVPLAARTRANGSSFWRTVLPVHDGGAHLFRVVVPIQILFLLLLSGAFGS